MTVAGTVAQYAERLRGRSLYGDVEAVGRQPEDRPGAGAVMIVTADSPVPREVVDGIVATDGFHAGRTVSL